MAKAVKFNNDGFYTAYEEFGRVNCQIESVPPEFDNAYDDHAKVVLLDSYCMLFPEGRTDKKPVMYFRHTDVAKNKFRFGNIVDLGDNPYDVQKGVLHVDEAADASTPITKAYGKNDDGTLSFEAGEKVKQVYYENCTNIKENDYLDLTAYPWVGFSLYDHQSTYENCSCVFHPSTFMGTLDGKPVIGLGSFDRLCMKQNTSKEGFGSVPLSYIAVSCMGIRKDGRREFFFASIGLSKGARTIAAYKIDGEEGIICDEVEFEADWHHLPYVDDGTCVFKDAVVRFADKEVHFEGKWGTKGFLKEPRIEKHGQSQMFGKWYEGKEKYDHRIYYTFTENMEAYDKNLEELGFDVVD